MQCIPGAELWEIEGAAHFMIATHPEKVAKMMYIGSEFGR